MDKFLSWFKDLRTKTTPVHGPSVDEVRTKIVELLYQSTIEVDHCSAILAQPFSNAYEWAQKLASARGHQSGLARAMEVIEAAKAERN